MTPMRLRLLLSIIVLAALAANPCFAKDSHAQRGARAGSANASTSGKGTSGANPPPNNANVPAEAGETIAPPVLPPHSVAQPQLRIVNPSAKNLVNAPHSQPSVITSTAPGARNPIGQPVVAATNSAGAPPGLPPALRASGIVASPRLVPLGAARVNVTSSGSVNGTTVIRPAIAQSAIGGPAQPHYGINGTTVQNRH
jgi:hypothetical protein